MDMQITAFQLMDFDKPGQPANSRWSMGDAFASITQQVSTVSFVPPFIMTSRGEQQMEKQGSLTCAESVTVMSTLTAATLTWICGWHQGTVVEEFVITVIIIQKVLTARDASLASSETGMCHFLPRMPAKHVPVTQLVQQSFPQPPLQPVILKMEIVRANLV